MSTIFLQLKSFQFNCSSNLHMMVDETTTQGAQVSIAKQSRENFICLCRINYMDIWINFVTRVTRINLVWKNMFYDLQLMLSIMQRKINNAPPFHHHAIPSTSLPYFGACFRRWKYLLSNMFSHTKSRSNVRGTSLACSITYL